MYGDLKLTFIQQALQQYMQECTAAIRAAAARAKIGVTGDAINSLAYEALQVAGGGTATLSFKEYLRMVDMGVGRGHPLGGLKSMTVALQSSNRKGIAYMKDLTRKPKPIYSRTVYGKLTWLQSKLLYGYTEETIALLKQQLQNGTLNNPA